MTRRLFVVVLCSFLAGALIVLAASKITGPSLDLTDLEIEKRKRLMAEWNHIFDVANRKQQEMKDHDRDVLKAHGVADGTVDWDKRLIVLKAADAPKPAEPPKAEVKKP